MSEPLNQELYKNVESAFQEYRNNPNAQTFESAFKTGLNAMGLEEYSDAILEKAKLLSKAGRYSSEGVSKAAEGANDAQLQAMSQIVTMNINFEQVIADSKIGVIGFFEKAITFVRGIDEMFLGGGLSDTLDSFEEKLDGMKENIQDELSASNTRINDGQLAKDVTAQQSRVTEEAGNINTDNTGSYANSLVPDTGATASSGIGNNDQILTKREFTLMAAQNGMTPAQIDGVDFDTIAGSDNNITGQEGMKLIEALADSGAQQQSISETASSVIGELRPVGP